LYGRDDFGPLAAACGGFSPYGYPERETMAKPVFILNGPNLNLLGHREPGIYGRETLADIEARAAARAKALGLEIDFRQTNNEGELVGWVQDARTSGSAIIVNAAGLTHTSVALLDALQAAELPVVEVHLSNIFRRDSFRQHSYVSLAATGVICGLGAAGYELALEAVRGILDKKSSA
jgi:3-dehydroquinate dehydratase-2